jgi:hypothetical protein
MSIDVTPDRPRRRNKTTKVDQTPKSRRSKRWTGGYGATTFFAQCDGRTREGRFLKAVTADLLRHVGPNATVVQRVLVARAAVLMLRLQQADRKIIADDEDLSALDNNLFVAWSNCLSRTLGTLGLSHLARQPASAGPKLAEILQRGRAA